VLIAFAISVSVEIREISIGWMHVSRSVRGEKKKKYRIWVDGHPEKL
jgi:hypothetical protein